MATDNHLSTARHGRRLQGQNLDSGFEGACAVVAGGYVLVETVKWVLLLPFFLAAIPGINGIHDRVTKVRGLAFSEGRACLFSTDEVFWEVDQPHLEVVRHGRFFSRVAVTGHEVRMHRRCALALADLWRDVD